MVQASFCFYQDHTADVQEIRSYLVFRELKPKCCFVRTRFQVFEVQGTEFWKP